MQKRRFFVAYILCCSAGLSSILDLNDVSVDSQLSLFTVSERNRITSYFLKKYRLDPKKMPKFFENTWIIVCNVSICGIIKHSVDIS